MPLPIVIIICLVLIIGAVNILIIAMQHRKSDYGRQHAIILRNDNWIEFVRLNMYLGFATDMDKKKSDEMIRAWGVDAGNQIIDPKTNSYHQVYSERDATPLQIFGDETAPITRTAMKIIAHQVSMDEINYAQNKNSSIKNLKWMGWTALILALLLAAEVILKIHAAGVF